MTSLHNAVRYCQKDVIKILLFHVDIKSILNNKVLTYNTCGF